MEKLFIPIILATGREGRRSEVVAHFMVEKVGDYVETKLVDVRDYAIPLTIRGRDNKLAQELSEIFTRADGFIIIAPEYNHGYPGELKMMLDRLYKEYNRKPLGIAGVSAGILGGARMVEQLRLVSIELQMVPIRNALYFCQTQNIFNDDGNPKKPEEFEDRIKGFMEELLWYARVLKRGREATD